MATKILNGVIVNGSNGDLTITASTDGGDYNIFSANGTKVLAVYGSSGNIMHLNLVDGDLQTGGTTRLSNTGVLQNTAFKSRINSTASSATPAINTDTTDQFNITALAVAITSMTTNLTGTPNDGDTIIIRIKDNGTARAIAWGTSYVSSGVATLPTTTVISKTHTIGLRYDSAAAKWVCLAADATGY